jgi:hypothetical protein
MLVPLPSTPGFPKLVRRFAGDFASRILITDLLKTSKLASKASALPRDDPRFIRVREILGRLLACAGLETLPWRIEIARDAS